MKSFSIVLSALVVLCFSCSETEEKQGKPGDKEYSIKGVVKNMTGQVVFLEEERDRNWVVIDSAHTENDSIELHGFVSDAGMYRMRTIDNKFFPILIDGKPAELEVDMNKPFQSLHFSKGEDNQKYAAFIGKWYTFIMKDDALAKKLDSLKTADPRSDSAAFYMKEKKSLEADMEALVKESIEQNLNSYAVFSMLYFLDWENDFPYIESVINKVKVNFPDYKNTISLVSNLNQYKAHLAQKAEKDKTNPAAVGKEAPEFVLPDTKGKMIRLSSYRGKYVLIDFWASWCGPCRHESPNVVRAYQAFKGKNFDILSVSLDDNQAKWEQAIQQDGLVWKHVSDLKGWQSSVVGLYKIEGIPATYLLDPNGIVIARDLRGDALEEKLGELLNK